jgi:peptide/nickel transport system substrate-binding protein
MFAKRNKIMWRILWGVIPFCVIAFLFTSPCSAQKAPKGKIVVVSREVFNTNGGDPHTAFGFGAININNMIHEGLVKKGFDGRLVPAVAKSWAVSADGLVAKFTLNERAKFHNNDPVTAEDVKFSIERAMRPEFKFVKGAAMRRYIDRIEIVDPSHVNVHFKSPYPQFFEWCHAFLGIVPKAYVEKVGDAEFAKHPIGTGPFKWVDYQQDVFVKAEAVTDHYRKTPSVSTVEFKFAVDEATIMAMFKAGEADLVGLPVATFTEVKKNPKLGIVWSRFIYVPTLLFGDLTAPDKPSPFKDVRVRQAASYAINRKGICDNILHGAAEPWGDIFAPYEPGFDPKIKPTPYDPAKAKALLKEAGYPNGFETTFVSGHPIGDKTEMEAIASDLAKVGIKGKFVDLEGGAYVRSFGEKKLLGVLRSSNPWWGGVWHPGVALEGPILPENLWTYYTSPELEAAWKKLIAVSDEKSIAARARDLSKVWRESALKPTLWAFHQPFGISERVKTYTPLPGIMQMGGLEYLELKD